jgi:hypothetical protein
MRERRRESEEMDGYGCVEWRSANMIIRKPGSQAGMDIDTAQDIARSESNQNQFIADQLSSSHLIETKDRLNLLLFKSHIPLHLPLLLSSHRKAQGNTNP